MHALATSSTSEALPAQWASRIFDRLTQAFGNKFADLYAGVEREEAQAEWAIGLRDMTPHEIARGIEACRRTPFAPNLGEFARMCRPSLDPEYAFREAQIGLAARDRGEVGEWSHPGVYRAAMRMSWDVQRKSYREARFDWERTLNSEFEKGWGEDVPPVPKKVEHCPTTTHMPAAVRARLAASFPQLGAKKS